MLTYKQAFDKLTEAYIRNQIRPFQSSFCFCGTLNEQKWNWWNSDFQKCGEKRHNDGIHYDGSELFLIEDVFLNHIHKSLGTEHKYSSYSRRALGGYIDVNKMPEYEEVLFEAFSKALDVLKQIHIERGEDVEDTPVFTKRVLQTA